MTVLIGGVEAGLVVIVTAPDPGVVLTGADLADDGGFGRVAIDESLGLVEAVNVSLVEGNDLGAGLKDGFEADLDVDFVPVVPGEDLAVVDVGDGLAADEIDDRVESLTVLFGVARLPVDTDAQLEARFEDGEAAAGLGVEAARLVLDVDVEDFAVEVFLGGGNVEALAILIFPSAVPLPFAAGCFLVVVAVPVLKGLDAFVENFPVEVDAGVFGSIDNVAEVLFWLA